MQDRSGGLVGEEIDQVGLFEFVSGSEEWNEVAGQGGGVARDVDDSARLPLRKESRGLVAQSAAWRIGDYEVGSRFPFP